MNKVKYDMDYAQLKNARLHFMGIGGQGISAVAQMALQGGARVTGCDAAASATTQTLAELGIPVQIGHSPAHLHDADVLVYVPAVEALNPDNPELVAARASAMPVMTWQEMLGRWTQEKCLLSVSGVHGKGTTTAMLALALVDAGLDPTCEIGAIIPRFGVNYRLGQSTYFVNEADEFNNNFWHYHPRLAVVTSIEFEHPEFFADYAEYLAAFEHFVYGMDMQGDWPFEPTLILNVDSPGCLELQARIAQSGDWHGRIITYAVEGAGETKEAHFVAYDVKLEGETSFRLRTVGDNLFGHSLVDQTVSLQLPGIHNVQNALAALTAAASVGIDPRVTIRTLEGFTGIRRRFEIRHAGELWLGGKTRDVLIVDDYAHHPTAIAATLEAARQRYPGRRLIAVYQPHMYSRTKTFFAQFLTAFDSANEVFIVDIFPGREHDTGLIHARDLVEALQRRHRERLGSGLADPGGSIVYGGDIQNTVKLLRNTLRTGDLLIIMGAGDVYMVTEQLLQESVGRA